MSYVHRSPSGAKKSIAPVIEVEEEPVVDKRLDPLYWPEKSTIEPEFYCKWSFPGCYKEELHARHEDLVKYVSNTTVSSWNRERLVELCGKHTDLYKAWLLSSYINQNDLLALAEICGVKEQKWSRYLQITESKANENMDLLLKSDKVNNAVLLKLMSLQGLTPESLLVLLENHRIKPIHQITAVHSITKVRVVIRGLEHYESEKFELLKKYGLPETKVALGLLPIFSKDQTYWEADKLLKASRSVLNQYKGSFDMLYETVEGMARNWDGNMLDFQKMVRILTKN